MINMAKADLYRLVRIKSIYLCISAIAVMYLINLITNQPIIITAGYQTETLSDSSVSIDIAMLSCNFNYYFLMLFPVSALIISDFSGGMISNTLSSFTSRNKYFAFKFMFTQCLSLVLFWAGNTIYYLLHLICYGSGSSAPANEFFRLLLIQTPIFIAMISLFVFLAFLIKRATVFNTIMISVPILYSGLIGLLMLVRSTKSFAAEHLVTYDLTTVFERVTRLSSDTMYLFEAETASFLFSAVMFLVGIRYFNKCEAIRE